MVVFVFLIVSIADYAHFWFLHFLNWRIFKKVMKKGHFLTKKWEFLNRSVSGADFLHPGVFDLADHELGVIFRGTPRGGKLPFPRRPQVEFC